MILSGTGVPATLFFDDLTPGAHFNLGIVDVDREEMIAYAQRFDPQWYHVNAEAAKNSEYGDLIASGFFTISLFMRAYVDHVLARAAAAASPGLEELRWRAAVYAGDQLAVGLDVLDAAASSRPGLGTVTLVATMTRVSDGKDVLHTRFRGWFAQRPSHKSLGGVPAH